jgi:hypothetical protein
MVSPNYTAPSLVEMRTTLARTLRDPNGVVFTSDMLDDFIREALSDMSGYRPIEATESQVFDPDTVPITDESVTPETLSYVWQVVFRNDDLVADPLQTLIIPYVSMGEAAFALSGWDYYAGRVVIGRHALYGITEWYRWSGVPLTIVMSGYRDHMLPLAADGDDQLLDLYDVTDQLCLTRTCRMLGFQMLTNDRALYQQWLAATNNTDVSPTQLQGMLNIAQGDVERQRKRSAVIRRTPTIGPQYP